MSLSLLGSLLALMERICSSSNGTNNCINNESKTVFQISDETGITISKVYRNIRKLYEKQLLFSIGNITPQKRKEFLYRSKIRKVVTVFDEDEIDVKIYANLRG